MTSDTVGVKISINIADDAGQRELMTATSALAQELSGVGRVEPGRLDSPTGAKSLGALDPGSFILTGAVTTSLLRALARVVTAFVQRRSAQRVVMDIGGDKLVIDGASTSTQRALVDAWIERQASGGETVTREPRNGSSRTTDKM